jgi:hypothetical protein
MGILSLFSLKGLKIYIKREEDSEIYGFGNQQHSLPQVKGPVNKQRAYQSINGRRKQLLHYF